MEVTKLFLSVPGVQFLLSERFCQDPLESYFGSSATKEVGVTTPL